ncbi:MAG: AMP-binding protein [Actinomycetota bacterium]|nr:AMP-binding protein [Actinomycetota bacterium]
MTETPTASSTGTPRWAAHLPPGTDPADVDLLADGTLVAAWTRRWAAGPERPVLHTVEHGWWTAAHLEEASRRVAGRLVAAGLERGDRVLMSAASSAELVAAHVGALRAGLVVIPANTAYQQREIAHLVNDGSPRAAVVDDETRAGWLRAADPSLVVTSPAVELPDGPDPAWLDDVGAGEPAVIGYTSGTTGAPKGAVLTHANTLASAAALRIAWRWSPDDRLVLALPLFHAHGLMVGLHGTLLAGASAVLQHGFDADRVLDAVAEHSATLFFGVPTMYARFAASPRIGELAALRLCVSGSAPLPPSIFETIAGRGGQRPLERYGMTETLMNVSNPHDAERRPGTVGFPLPGVEVKLAGGNEGEILLRGPNVFGGYWRNPDATAKAFDDDGWFRSGDLGTFDDDGYLAIVGRSKELIITGGYNVYPREVEEVLLRRPEVVEVAVAGTPSEEWGEVVTAYVVCDGDLDREAFDALAAESLASYKRPRLVHVVDAIPKNALGKVLRHELAPPA